MLVSAANVHDSNLLPLLGLDRPDPWPGGTGPAGGRSMLHADKARDTATRATSTPAPSTPASPSDTGCGCP